MQNNLFNKATNPNQYDLETLDWEEMGQANSPSRQLFKHYLLEDESYYQEKDVLDVGSGTGWLLDDIRQAGAKSVTGIEPSQQNVDIAHKNYPAVNTICTSLEEYENDHQYDVIVSVQVMVHIADVKAAMKKFAALLRPGGELIFTVPNFDYMKIPRFNYEIELEERSEDEYVVAITRSNGVMIDVIRKPSVYQEAAKQAGLDFTEERGLVPTPQFLEQEPKYERFKNQPIADLLRFRKT